MAMQSIIPAASASSAQNVAALAASTASAEIVLGGNALFEINSNQDITIAFGTTGMGAPTATSYRIPANQPHQFDLTTKFDRIRVFNISASPANVYVLPISRF